ncbi:uncharacterized protein LOC134684069 [Mytilus trossulus]|uniref:uncharacterized protein LOC134684069 n=1 Tax=Mytilus trossulus TaxID=6551 RepID=UPI003006BFEC
MADSDTEDPHLIVGKDGKGTATGKGKIKGDAAGVTIEVSEIGTTIDFKTDFEGETHYKSDTPHEDYKSDTYQFVRGKGNPEINRKDGYSYIKFSLTKIKK